MDRNGAGLWVPFFRGPSMRRMFVTILIAFVSALLLFMIIITSVFYLGFKNSVAGWEKTSGKAEREQVKALLEAVFSQYSTNPAELTVQLKNLLPQGIPVEIYDSEKNLLYKNDRPHGYGGRWHSEKRDLSQIPFQKFTIDEKTAGYFWLGPVSFGSSRANTRFISTMKKTVLYAIASAFILALVVALFFSKLLSKSAQMVAQGINQLARGNLIVQIPKTGISEIAIIANSANILGEKLRREEELRKQWASDIAHDLRTPITALRTQFEGMIDGILDLTPDRISENMKELERVESLVNDLAELTRLESPEYRLNRTTVSTDRLLHDLRTRFDPQCRNRNIRLKMQNSLLEFTADKHLILRAVSNLMSNALRHTPEGGIISVTIGRAEENSSKQAGILISVFNSGSVIPPGEMDRIFDRLYRGEYARYSPGSGLGLTIAKKIAELHNGRLSVESNPDTGTTFKLYVGGQS